MIRLAIVVEGETEEEFVKNLLTPHLQTRGVLANPHPLGGNVTDERLASDMANYFWSYDRVTSLVDFYEHLMPNYQKRVDGPYLAKQLGLSVIRSACPRFGKWIDRLESLQGRMPPP